MQPDPLSPAAPDVRHDEVKVAVKVSWRKWHNWPLALIHKGRFWLLLEPRDLWFGIYVSPRAIFYGVPCLVVKWERRCA